MKNRADMVLQGEMNTAKESIDNVEINKESIRKYQWKVYRVAEALFGLGLISLNEMESYKTEIRQYGLNRIKEIEGR